MKSLREFFVKKKADRKFDKAGPGHKLNEEKPVTSSQSISHPPVPRQPPANIASRKAAEAALARVEQQQTTPVNWSHAAVRAQARKEIELEQAVIEKEKNKPKEVVQEACQFLTVSGVYFACPLIGPDVLTYAEMEVKIKEFLYKQLAEEQGLASCLIIHTCNKNKEKVQLGVETLSRYLTNIIDNPTEEKYHRIRINNRVFQERVASLEGVHDFLVAAGFCKQTLKLDEKEEEYYVYPEENLLDLENLQMLKEALLSAEPIKPVLDRNLKILLPSQITEKVNLPEDFFSLSRDEIKREQEERIRTVELNSELRTKAMREQDKIRENRKYRYTLIRIRFPNDIILQGTFGVNEKLSAVKEFIISNLNKKDKEFILLIAGGGKLTDDECTLSELKLVPAVILNFLWKNEEVVGENEEYLISETMALLQNL